MNDVTDYYPETSNDVLSQDKSQEKRARSTISPNPTVTNQHPLHEEADQHRKPKDIDVSTICNCIRRWMQPPPQKLLTHRRQENHNEQTNTYSLDACKVYIARWVAYPIGQSSVGNVGKALYTVVCAEQFHNDQNTLRVAGWSVRPRCFSIPRLVPRFFREKV